MNCDCHTNAIGYTIVNTFSLLSKLFKPCDLISSCLDTFYTQFRCRSGGDDPCVFARDHADARGGLLLPSTPSFGPLLSFASTTSASPVHGILLAHHSTPLFFIKHVARHLMQAQPYSHVVRRTIKSFSSRMKHPAAPLPSKPPICPASGLKYSLVIVHCFAGRLILKIQSFW